MPPNTHERLRAQWRLERLIGRTIEQEQLQQMLRDDVPQRRGRTVVISGPVGSGRVALARYALSTIPMLPRSVELDVGSGEVQWYATEPTEAARLRRVFQIAMGDVAQRLPFPLGTLVAVLAALVPQERQDALRARLRGGITSRRLPSLVEDIAGTAPLALHITGLDEVSLADEWHDTLVALAETIHERWPVLLLLTTVAARPLPEFDEPLLTPLQRRLRPLIDSGIVQAWHLGPISVADVRRYVSSPADELVSEQLHSLAGGWPLLIQALWHDWTNSAQKLGGGGSTKPVITRDGETEPWHFTLHGLTATAHVETLLDDLLDAYTDGPEMLATIIDDGEDWKAVLCWLLALGTLEGPSFTGMVVAHAAGLPWEDVEEVLDVLVDAGLLADAPDGYDTLGTDDGQQPLYRYTFALPIWWHLFRRYISDDQLREDAGYMAEALEHCYGPLAWQHLNTIVQLWDLAGNPDRVRLQRRVLEQHAFIDRLKVRALLTELYAKTQGTWLDAHQAWQEVAKEMCGYVPDAETFAAFEQAQKAAQLGGSSLEEAITLGLIAYWANMIFDDARAEMAVNQGFALIESSDDTLTKRIRANLLHELGRVHHARNELEQALRYLEQARQLKEAHGRPLELAITLHELGRVHHTSMELDSALRCLTRARWLIEAHGTPSYLAITLHELGKVHHARNELELALNCLESARQLHEVHSAPRNLVITLYRLAFVRYDRREYDQALIDIRRTLEIERNIQAEHIDKTEALERRILEALQAQGATGEEE